MHFRSKTFLPLAASMDGDSSYTPYTYLYVVPVFMRCTCMFKRRARIFKSVTLTYTYMRCAFY